MPPTEKDTTSAPNPDSIKSDLEDDIAIKLSGCDVDGTARGKLVIKDKFIKSLEGGFGFCDVIFGWDINDRVYDSGVSAVSNATGGFQDIVARIDPTTHRRIPWENNIPHFLVDFYNPNTGKPMDMCPRGLLKRVVKDFEGIGMRAMAGFELEFFCFKETPETLAEKKGTNLTPLDPGMFGYSLLRPTVNQSWYYEIYNSLAAYDIPLEGWHTETGPGVYEAAIQYSDALKTADRGHLFKTAVKQISVKYGIMPSFMAKPWAELPGCSGHIHVSLVELIKGGGGGKNLFAADGWKEGLSDKSGMKRISDVCKWFVAGVLEGLPSIMAVLCPTINSYKRLVENYWAPVTISYGFENRTTSLRIIGPPSCSPTSTRIELRVSGADVNPYLAISALLACGFRGITKKMQLPFPPASGDASAVDGEEIKRGGRLARNLKEAVEKMSAAGSVAREVLGDGFVEHYAATRMNEWKLWERAVTNWEVSRYFETV